MAIYTNSFQDEMFKYNNQNLTYQQKLVLLCNEFFDFDFDYNDTEFKAWFEPFFIEHFFNEEFAFETNEYFKIKLKTKMSEILPSYILQYKNFKYLQNQAIGLISKTLKNQSTKSTTNGTNNSKNNQNSQSNEKDISSNLPLNVIDVSNIDDVNYADFGKITKNEQTTTSNGESNKNETHENNVDDIEQHFDFFEYNQKTSNEFVKMASEMISKFNDLFLIIF